MSRSGAKTVCSSSSSAVRSTLPYVGVSLFLILSCPTVKHNYILLFPIRRGIRCIRTSQRDNDHQIALIHAPRSSRSSAGSDMSSSFEKSVKGGTKVKVGLKNRESVGHHPDKHLLTASPSKSQICRAYPPCDTVRRGRRRRSLSHLTEPIEGCDMDSRIQGADHCTHDDQGRTTRCDTEVPGGCAQDEIGIEFIHGRYATKTSVILAELPPCTVRAKRVSLSCW